MLFDGIPLHTANQFGTGTARIEAPENTQREQRHSSQHQNLHDQHTGRHETGGLGQILTPVENFAESFGLKMQFRVDDESGKVQVRILDNQGEQILREVPSDAILELAAAIKNSTNSVFHSVA